MRTTTSMPSTPTTPRYEVRRPDPTGDYVLWDLYTNTQVQLAGRDGTGTWHSASDARLRCSYYNRAWQRVCETTAEV